MPSFEYTEKVDNYSPSNASFSFEAQSATYPMYVDYADLENCIFRTLGDVKLATSGGGLKRIPPLAHPQWPWLYAKSIQGIQGMQFSEALDGEEEYGPLEAEALQSFAAYTQYVVPVTFTSRPYAILPDNAIDTETITWYTEDDDETSSTVPQEYLRFCDYDYNPQDSLLTAQRGQMEFYTGDASPPNGQSFPARPSMNYPMAMIKFRWFHVPAALVEHPSSWILKGKGRINQVDFMQWPAGSLLYVDVNHKRYTPVVPRMQNAGVSAVFAIEKMCDIEFHFLYTIREAKSPTPTPDNRNWLAAGHNLQPWFVDRGYHYVTTKIADTSKRVPTYLSFPFQLLFCNPEIL